MDLYIKLLRKNYLTEKREIKVIKIQNFRKIAKLKNRENF